MGDDFVIVMLIIFCAIGLTYLYTILTSKE